MQNLVTSIINDFFIWLIIGFAAWRVLENAKDSKIGGVITSIFIGGAAYYFAKNPETVLRFAGELVAKIFNRG